MILNEALLIKLSAYIDRIDKLIQLLMIKLSACCDLNLLNQSLSMAKHQLKTLVARAHQGFKHRDKYHQQDSLMTTERAAGNKALVLRVAIDRGPSLAT